MVDNIFPIPDAQMFENSSLFRSYINEDITLSERNTLFLCDICSFLCKDKDEFELHSRESHSEMNKVEEIDDDETTYTGNEIQFQNEELTEVYAETTPNEDSTEERDLKLNNLESEDDSSRHFEFVESSNKQNYVLPEIDSHKAKKKVKNLVHECEICEKVFNRFSNLNAHLTSHTRDYACYVCCNSYASQFRLDQHMTLHSEECLAHFKDSPAVIQCPLCSDVFYSKYVLYEHKKLHQNVVEYSCDECEKKFTSYRLLVSHKKRHEDSIVCNVCGKVYSSEKVLLQHLRLHSGEKPYECTVCNMKFRFQSGLSVHERVHTGEKKYKCGQCDKMFARGNYLKEHMRIHFNDKPFKCEFCEAMFTQKNVLKTHVTKKHRKCSVCALMVGDALQLRMHIWRTHPEEHTGLSDTDNIR